MTQIVHQQVVQFQLQILIVHQHQTVVRRVTQMQAIQQVVRFRHLSQIPLLIANQLVSQSRLQTLIVPQHQTVVRRVTQMRVIQQVVQCQRLSQIPLPIASQLVNQLVNQSQLQTLTVPQHQIVVRRVIQMRVIQQVAQHQHLSQIQHQ